MASWNQNPIWTLIDLINNGKQIEPGDGFLASDMVKIVENLQYLYNISLGNINEFGLTQGDQKYSIVQKIIKSDDSVVTTKAYQRGTTALGGGTVAGDSNGVATDYSFAFVANEKNKAIPKASAVFGRYNTAHNIGEFVCGNYADNNRDPRTVFAVGTGIDDSRRSTGFEVRTDGRCYSYGKSIATQEYVNNRTVTKQGNPYVVYINEAGGKSTVMPYRFQKQSIVDAEFALMFQPMHNGRLYTRYPTDEYHAANKGYVDSKTSLYKHVIRAANALFNLIVINNSSAKITTFTSLLGANYVSMYVGTPACTPVVELSIIYEGADANAVGIKVGWNLDGLNFIQYLDSNLESDTVTEL